MGILTNSPSGRVILNTRLKILANVSHFGQQAIEPHGYDINNDLTAYSHARAITDAGFGHQSERGQSGVRSTSIYNYKSTYAIMYDIYHIDIQL